MAGTGGSEAAVALDELRSWWEVPAIAHFCSLFRTAFRLPDFEIEVRPRGPDPRRNSENFPRAPPPSLLLPPVPVPLGPHCSAGHPAAQSWGGPRALGGVPVPGPKSWRREEGTARAPPPAPTSPGCPRCAGAVPFVGAGVPAWLRFVPGARAPRSPSAPRHRRLLGRFCAFFFPNFPPGACFYSVRDGGCGFLRVWVSAPPVFSAPAASVSDKVRPGSGRAFVLAVKSYSCRHIGNKPGE